MSQPTVAVSMLRALLAYLGDQGLDTATLTQSLTLERDALAFPERSVDAAHYEQLMQAGIAALHNPMLGLEFGMAARPGRWGTLGALLRHCATIGEALVYQARFAHLVNAIGEGRLIDNRRDVAIEWHSAHTMMPALVEEAFAAWVGFARWASVRATAPLRVEFAHRAQGDPALYEAFFGCPVVFSAPMSRLCFDPALIDLPLRSPDAEMAAHLSRQVAERQRAADARDMPNRLQRWLMNAIDYGVPDLRSAAAALAIGERRLQQRLQAQGTTFRACVENARRTLALSYLDNARLSIGDISDRLGFSEQSAFQRAFRRWFDTTPLAWRHRR